MRRRLGLDQLTNLRDQFGDGLLRLICGLAGVVAAVVLVAVAYQIVHNAHGAISRFGLGFLGHDAWAPNFNVFGAASLIFGTAVSAFLAVAIAGPLGIAIGLYLALMAPRRVGVIVGPLVEMLAAIPSIVLGFWGVIVFAPFVQRHIEPALHDALGFIPLFGAAQTTGLGIFTAALILTIMVLPIVASLSRDLFMTVPTELTEGAQALGATRWEIIRGVILPSTVSGVAAATLLGLGRALGEAIAVAEVVGDGTGIHSSLFAPGATLASRIALQFDDAGTALAKSSLFYLAVVLLVISLLTSLAARAIAGRFDVARRLA